MSKNISKYNNKYSLPQQIISAVTAVGFIMQPIVALANNIIKSDGTNLGNENVTNIWADKIVANAAVNQFQNFQLDANKIANMYFNVQGSNGNDAANLVNFVNSRIDINGTVNAVQNSKIGGNLFFLSKEGMVVGKSGVINTGALYVMTPAAGIDNIDNIVGTNSKEFDYTYEGLKGQFASGMENKIPDTLDRMMNLNIPLNASGTISVLGKINAANDVKLAAAKIAVGKNVSGEAVFDTAADGIVREAAIATGINNFSNFVNINGISAGLGNNLTATADGNGDIILAAKAEYVNAQDAAFNNFGTDIGLGVVENTQRTIEATVENYGTINAKGDAVLTAEVTNGNKDLAEELLVETTPAGVNNPDYVPVPADDAGSFVQTRAQVDVQGDITAGKDIKVAANADNTYVDYNSEVADTISTILGYTVAPINADVVILSNTANVNIAQDADLKAGDKIDVTANAVLDGTAGAAANGRKLIKKVPDAIPGAAVSYAKMENSATVTVNGTLTASGENAEDGTPAVKVQANADERFSNTASMNYKSGIMAGTAAIGAAVAVSESKNNAAVQINGTITADNGDAVVQADAINTLVANAMTSSPDTTVGSTAINVFTHDGHAQINVDGTIAAQNITVDATNYIDENTITADNALGMSKLQAEFMNAADIKGIANAVKENSVVKGILGKISSGAEDGPGLTAQLADKLSVGAAVAVTDENNSANVTFANTAKLNATNDINIDANIEIYDSHITASGKTTSYKNSDISGTTVDTTVGAGVVYAGMDNNSSVIFEDGSSADNGTNITATNGNVNITSSTKMEYHRPERIKRELDRSIENLQYAIAAINDLENIEEENKTKIIAQLTDLKDSLENYAKNYTDDFINSVSNPDAITGESTMNEIFNMAAGAAVIYNNVLQLQQDFNSITADATSPFGALVTNALGVVTNAVAFADPNNYANVAAAASARSGDGTKLSVSGSVALTNSTANSSVDVGKFTKISAGKDLTVQSANKIEDVNITGKTMFWQSDAAAKGGTGVGGSFNYQNFDTDSKVVVDEGAQLTASGTEGNISLSSDSNIFHVGAMLSAGMSDGNGISGMVTLTDSDSYNNVIVDTDAVLQAAKAIDISANNDTNVNNAILALSASGSNAAVGMGIAINNIDVQNTAQIIDNDGTEGEEDQLTGEISAAALNVTAETTGLINTISIAGGITKSGDDGEEGFLDKLKAPFQKMETVKTNALNKVNAVSNKLQDVISTMGSGSAAQGGGKAVNTAEAEAGVPGFTFAGAGSVSLNMVEDTTKAVIDGANIKLKDEGNLTVGARDSAFIGAWSGGAAVSYRKGMNNSTSVAVSGAVGVNDIDNEVTALVKNSTVTGVKDVDVTSVSGGTAVAAGIEAALTIDSSQGKNYGGGASVSVNLIDKDVNANMEDVSLTGAADGAYAYVDVTAYESDIQVTGGVNADIAIGGGNMAGGAVTVADITNNIDAGISGGSYKYIQAVDVQGLSAVTQVTAAVSAGIAAGGQGSSNAFSGAVVYNGLTNNVQAGIADASIERAPHENATSVTVQASDISASSAEAKPYQDLLGDYDEHKKFAEERDIYTDGKAYYEDADTADENIEYTANGGSTIVGAAVVAAGTNGNAAGAAVNVADINNSFTASIENADIKAEFVEVNAEADTLLVGVSGGIAVGAKQFGGMGSVTWQDIDNDVKAQVINTEFGVIGGREVDISALNKTQAVNVAGSVAIGKTAGIGAALAYNDLDNNVGAYLQGSHLYGDGLSLKAANTGKVYGIGAGVAASTGSAAVNGSVAINKGATNTEAVIDEYIDENGAEKRTGIKSVDKIDVTAEDDTYRLAVVGSVTGSGKVAAGGAIAYNDIGGSSADTEKSGQRTVAAINNTDIENDKERAYVNVKADDKSELKTIAVGVGGSGNVAVQGAAATALINKQVEASMTDTNKTEGSAVTVTADNNSNVTTSANVAAVSGNAAVGAGVAVNRIVQQTNASVNGGKMDFEAGNLLVKANSTPRITNIGVGGSGAGSGAAVTGSVAVNMINNDVNAHIGSGAEITADGSIGIVATSDEQIANYAGTASFAGTGAAVGVSVSVNQIEGTTSATVGGSDEDKTTLTALGNSALTTATNIDKDKEINNTLINEETVALDSKIDRTEETRSGLIVDASSARDMKSFLINADVAVEGAGIAGTVNVNMIDGATNAAVTNTSVNNGTDIVANDVFVNAGDYTNSSGFVGTVGGTGIGAGVGLGSDTNTISREVSATVENSNVQAKKFEVDADSAQGVSSFAVGAGVAGIGGGVTGVVTVTELENATKAALLNSTVNADSVAVKATHKGIVNAGNVSVGAGIIGAGAGASVGVLKDNSETEVTVGSQDSASSSEKTNITAKNDITIAAANTTIVKPILTAVGAGAGAVAGAISVNNLNSSVKTNINNVTADAGGTISADADNKLEVDAYIGGNAASAFGSVGASVTINTIDSTVQTNVNYSNLTAQKDISLTAQEQRDIEQLATNAAVGGAAIGANVAVTSVGRKITDDNTVEGITGVVDKFNGVYDQDPEKNLGNVGSGILEENGIDTALTVGAEMGGGKDSQITVNLTGSSLNAVENVTAKAMETDNISMTLGSGSAGAVAAIAGVGVLNVYRNVGVNIAGGSIRADDVDIATDINGKGARLEVYQGSVGAIAGNAAIGKVHTNGTNKISIGKVTVNSQDIDVLAADHGNTDVDVLGIGFGAVAAGAIIGNATNESNTDISVTGSNMTADNVAISTEKANIVDAHATGGAGGVATGQGVVATAADSGESVIKIGSQSLQDGNTFTAQQIDINAVAKPVVKAVADSLAVSIIGTAGVAEATATANGTVSVGVYNNNKLYGDTVDIEASVLTQNGKNTAEAAVEGNSGSGLVNIGANTATANADMDVEAFVYDVDYKTETVKEFVGYQDKAGSTTGEREEVYKDVTVGATELTIKGSNNAKIAADAKGISIGGVFSSGNNEAVTSNTSTTNVTLNNGTDNTLLGSLNIVASGAGDNTAKADGSGGALISGDLAAYVENSMTSATKVSVSGKLHVEGDVNVSALQSDTANVNADALKATVAGASATKAVNEIGGTTSVEFKNADIVSDGQLVTAANNTVTFGNTEKYAVEGSGYGGVNVQGAVFDNTINKTAEINFNNAQIETLGMQVSEAKTTGDINAGAYIKAAGAGAFTWVDMDNKVTSNNNVVVGDGSLLRTKQEDADLVLSAVDNMNITASGIADVQGAAVGGASSDVANVLNRNNKITVSGDLYALNDVNLYAGRDSNGNDGKLNLVVESETYNYAALPIAKPVLDDAVNQNNQVVVNSTGNVDSVRNINIYADAGKETIRDTTLMYTWVYSDKGENYTSSTIGDKAPENKKANNYVQADGKLTAGVQNKQYITIGGTYDPETGTTSGSQLVFFNKDTLDAVNKYYKNDDYATDKPDISASEGVDVDGIVLGTLDYGTTLFERYNELGELMREYSEDTTSTAYIGYKTERDRILEQLKVMGLVEQIIPDDKNLEPYYAAVEGMKIDYIELPDIVASGGNINIQSDSLKGSGELKAQGAPEVVVNNNTNLYLKVNNITVSEPGGEINFNNIGLTSADKDKYGVTISPDAEAGKGGNLVINGNYNGNAVIATVVIDGAEQQIQTTPRADIEINGIVNSEGGTVAITSATNNIVIQGAGASESAAVKGQTVKLSASKGSVTQGFQEGIVSIGGNVQDQYAGLYNTAKNWYNNEYGYTHDDVKDDSQQSNTAIASQGNMIVGENVYINAADINVNGYIQSGYADYIVNIDQSVQSKIDEIQNNWKNNGGGVLTDAMVTTGTAYRIVEGKDIAGDNGIYSRQLDVYYNPFTGQIIVPDVDASGGQVYLTGRISSTGSGKINVLDGAYDITVNNKTATDLQLGKLVSNDVSGLISIADTGTKKLTEFTRDKTVVRDMSVVGEDGSYKVEQTSGASNVYNPEEGLRYNWTTGQGTTTEEKYSHTIKAGLWGAVTTLDQSKLEEVEREQKPTNPPTESQKVKPNGEYIGKIDDKYNDTNFVVIYENDKLEQERVGPGEPERWSTGFLGWFKWEKYTWSVTTGTTQQYVASVKADKPISIGFIGNAAGNSIIDVDAAGNINLTNNIASANGGSGSLIDITTTGGAINQNGGSIIGDNIKLNAVNGINNIDITSIGDNVALNAVNSGSGNVDIEVNAAYGTQGNVVIGNLFAGSANAQKGDVTLTATGNITQSGTGVSVSGNRIDLTSRIGGIGSSNQALMVNGGQNIINAADTLSASVNAQANNDIYLTQADGDMRIGRVYSNSGNVAVTVNNGDLIDALPSGEIVDRGNTAEMIQKWKDLGLLEGEGDYQDKIAQDIADYKASIQEEYTLYQNAKAYYDAHPDEAEKDTNYQQMLETYGKYNSADEYLAGSEAQDKIAELSEEGKGYWNQDLLLYAISDAIINPDSGATDNVVKDPNVKGKNITINIKSGSAGLNSDNVTEVSLSNLLDNIDQLKKLATADASNVIWDSEAGKATITEKLPIGIQMIGTDGKLNVNAADNVYFAGRTEDNANIENVMNIEKITSKGNVRLQVQDGVYNVADNGQTAIKGDHLLIQAGSGSIGTADAMMTTDISGTLQAQASGNIYLAQQGQNDLQIVSIGAGQDIVLQAVKNITDADITSAGSAVGYIRSDQGTITLDAGGNIGEDDNGLNILANAAEVSATAEGNISLEGVTAQDSIANEAIVLKDITSNNGNGTVTISSESAIWQAEGSQGIKAATLHTYSNEEQILNSKNNRVHQFSVAGLDDSTIEGSIEFVVDHADGLVADFDDITAENGAVYIENLQGNLSVQGDITTNGESAGNVAFISNGGISVDSTITSAADIVMQAKGAVTNRGNLQAADNVDIKTTTGAIDLGGSVAADQGYIEIETGGGQISAQGAVNAGTNVDIYTVEGNIDIGGNVDAAQGYIHVESGEGNISTSGAISGKQDVILKNQNGNITVDGTTESETQNVSATVTGDGNIQFVGSVSAAGNVDASVSGTGDIKTAENSEVNGTNINFTTNTGSIITGDDLASDEDVNLNVNTGDIILGGNVQGGYNPTATDPEGSGGNINITITGDGNLKDADNKDNYLTALSPDGNKDKGNINIKLQGIGDLDLYDLYATNDARVDVANGDLTLHKINGQLVAIQLRTKEKTLDVGELIAGTHIILRGDDLTLDQITQRTDADGMLIITPDGVNDDEPIDNFEIGGISTNEGSGLRFDYLWVNNADIHVDKGQLWFDKLAVEKVAYFSNNMMATSVYGTPPLRDGNDSIFWYNTGKINPKGDLDAWRNQENNGQWMYLRFTEKENVQESNGVLLRLTEYNYVYDQRFSGENHLRFLLGEDAVDRYDLTYTPYVVFGNRYNLYDLSDYNDTAKNADEDEIVVEV